MTGLSALLGWATAAVAVGFVVLAAAIWRGWFGRLHYGFRWALVCCLAGAALSTAVALGAWGYDAARAVVFQEQVNALTAVAAAAETSVRGDVTAMLDKLSNLAASPLVAGAATADRRQTEDQL